MENNQTEKEVVERLARLETKVHLKFAELDKSINLAAAVAREEKINTREQIAEHFRVVNNFQSRIDALTASFKTRDSCEESKNRIDEKVSANTKLIYTGVGILMALQIVFHFYKG